MSEDQSFDLVGVGRAMKAIPPAAWKKLVDTGCDTVKDVIAPITQAMAGVGRLIEAKFDRLVDAEKVAAAEIVEAAKRKAKRSKRQPNVPRPQILLQAIENGASETDVGVRELWSNLLANEMLGAVVHPEIGRVLARISSEDAQVLVGIVENSSARFTVLFAQAVRVAIKSGPFKVAVGLGDPTTFSHAHLENLDLIKREAGSWVLTVFGEGFIRAVTDPTMESMPS